MLDVEVLGGALGAPGVPAAAEVDRLCVLAASSRGVSEGHVAVEFVDASTITELNRTHRGRDAPTDVLSFPVDGLLPGAGASRELGDIVICPAHTDDVPEAVVHGMLHLLGMDHEVDGGEMLALQRELLARPRG